MYPNSQFRESWLKTQNILRLWGYCWNRLDEPHLPNSLLTWVWHSSYKKENCVVATFRVWQLFLPCRLHSLHHPLVSQFVLAWVSCQCPWKSPACAVSSLSHSSQPRPERSKMYFDKCNLTNIFGNAAFFRWWCVGVFPILDICKSPRSNPLHFLVTSPSISLNGSRRQ